MLPEESKLTRIDSSFSLPIKRTVLHVITMSVVRDYKSHEEALAKDEDEKKLNKKRSL